MKNRRKSKLDKTQYRYHPDPGTVKPPVFCGVCDSEMTFDEGVEGHWSWGAAMSRSPKTKRDVFVCPHHMEDWHRQVLALRRKAEESPSRVLGDLMLKEADEIVKTRKATKKVSVLQGL